MKNSTNCCGASFWCYFQNKIGLYQLWYVVRSFDSDTDKSIKEKAAKPGSSHLFAKCFYVLADRGFKYKKY